MPHLQEPDRRSGVPRTAEKSTGQNWLKIIFESLFESEFANGIFGPAG
jgi:hypothetical protein